MRWSVSNSVPMGGNAIGGSGIAVSIVGGYDDPPAGGGADCEGALG